MWASCEQIKMCIKYCSHLFSVCTTTIPGTVYLHNSTQYIPFACLAPTSPVPVSILLDTILPRAWNDTARNEMGHVSCEYTLFAHVR